MNRKEPNEDINVRSRAYYLAHAVRNCWRCRKPTSVFALALPALHERLDIDAVSQTPSPASEVWEPVAQGTFLFHVEYLPESVRIRLGDLAPCLRRGYGQTTQGGHWINHCARCGKPQDDHFLHCEPGAAFMPTTQAAASLIQLLEFGEPLAAWAAGYSHELPFFEFMPKLG